MKAIVRFVVGHKDNEKEVRLFDYVVDTDFELGNHSSDWFRWEEPFAEELDVFSHLYPSELHFV